MKGLKMLTEIVMNRIFSTSKKIEEEISSKTLKDQMYGNIK